MIANITSGSFTKGLIKYHEDKISEGKARVFHSNLLFNGTLGENYIRNVFNSLTSQSKRKDINFHVSLNFKAEDYLKLSTKQTKNIISDYLSQIGFPKEHPFVSYEHFDKKHPHIHIICPKILENGKSLDDSHIFRKSRRISRKIEEKYNISNAEKQKQGRVVNLKFPDYSTLRNNYDNKDINLKQLLSQSIYKYLSENKPINFKEFQNGLSDINIYLYKTKHKQSGLIYTTKQNTEKFQAKDTGIKASNLNKDFTIKQLESTFKQNKKEIQEKVKFIANKIDFIFFKYHKLDKETYKKELKKFNINLKTNETNNVLRGFSYEFEGIKYKGQQLPQRKYTMSKIAHKFSNKPIYSQPYIINILLKKHNLHNLKNTNIGLFITKAINAGLKPYITKQGIELTILNNNDKNNNQIKLIKNFNNDLNKLNDIQILDANSKIKQDILNINTIDDNNKKSLNIPALSILSFFDEIISEISFDDNSLEQDDMQITKQKKRRKKRL